MWDAFEGRLAGRPPEAAWPPEKIDIDILGRGAPGAWGNGLTSPPLPAPGAGKDEEVRGWALSGLMGRGGVLMGDGEGSDRGLVGATANTW